MDKFIYIIAAIAFFIFLYWIGERGIFLLPKPTKNYYYHGYELIKPYMASKFGRDIRKIFCNYLKSSYKDYLSIQNQRDNLPELLPCEKMSLEMYSTKNIENYQICNAVACIMVEACARAYAQQRSDDALKSFCSSLKEKVNGIKERVENYPFYVKELIEINSKS